MRPRMIHRLTIVAQAIVIILLATKGVRAEYLRPGRWAGTWTFNPDKSAFPDDPNVENTVVMKPDGTVLIHEKNATGKTRDWSYRPEVGKAVPVQGRGENVTVLVTKVNAYRLEQTWNYNGKPGHSYSTLSKDGKVQIFHVTRSTKDGKPFEEIIYFERQK
jgi:hypothetical protein